MIVVGETMEGLALVLLRVLLQEEHALEEVVEIGLVVYKAQFLIGSVQIRGVVLQSLPATHLGPHDYYDIGVDHFLTGVQYTDYRLGTGTGLS